MKLERRVRLPIAIFGMRTTEGFEQNLLNMTNLIQRATTEIQIASEKLDPEYFENQKMTFSIEGALDRGVVIDIVAGNKALNQSKESLQELGCSVEDYEYYMVTDFMVIDEKHYMRQILDDKGRQSTTFNYGRASQKKLLFALHQLGRTPDAIWEVRSKF